MKRHLSGALRLQIDTAVGARHQGREWRTTVTDVGGGQGTVTVLPLLGAMTMAAIAGQSDTTTAMVSGKDQVMNRGTQTDSVIE